MFPEAKLTFLWWKHLPGKAHDLNKLSAARERQILPIPGSWTGKGRLQMRQPLSTSHLQTARQL